MNVQVLFKRVAILEKKVEELENRRVEVQAKSLLERIKGWFK